MHSISWSDTDEPVIECPQEGEEWVILHVRPRAEKKACAAFEREGAAMYLPLRRRDHQYGSRKRAFWVPLFPGYVFGRFDVKALSLLKGSAHVANVLRVPDQVGLVHQLQQIQRALAVDEWVEVMPFLEKGRPVRVTGGPFKGVEGIVERLDKKTKVIISIEMIQQSVCMEVDSAYIEVV